MPEKPQRAGRLSSYAEATPEEFCKPSPPPAPDFKHQRGLRRSGRESCIFSLSHFQGLAARKQVGIWSPWVVSLAQPYWHRSGRIWGEGQSKKGYTQVENGSSSVLKS